MQEEIYKKIIAKKEFSKLRKKDVEIAFSHFEKRQTSDEEKIRLTRDLLRKVFSAFTSQKLLNLKDKEPEWFLKKHISTRERFEVYPELYSRLLGNFSDKKELNIIDLGCGVNGFSFNFLKKINSEIYYLGIESIGQLVELQNYHFRSRGLDSEARVLHESLFEINKVNKIINQLKGRKIVFLFKVIDSLEMLERNYSKKLISKIFSIEGVERIVLSFATESLIKRKKFFVSRKWIVDFIKENFKIEDDFIFGNERYIAFSKNRKN